MWNLFKSGVLCADFKVATAREDSAPVYGISAN